MSVAIRREQAGDERPIRALTEAAFRDMPYSAGTEGQIIEDLRADGDLELSLVALNADQAIVGHIAFSPVMIGGASVAWFQLGPVSVIPSGQNSGIGSQLIEAGIAELRARKARGIALVGNPEYYVRFGFTQEHDLTLSEMMDPVLQAMALEGKLPTGQLTLAPAYG